MSDEKPRHLNLVTLNEMTLEAEEIVNQLLPSIAVMAANPENPAIAFLAITVGRDGAPAVWISSGAMQDPIKMLGCMEMLKMQLLQASDADEHDLGEDETE